MTSIIKVDTIQTSAGGTPTASSLGIDLGNVGKISQVVSTTYSTLTTMDSSTFADTGISLAITPTAASSKVFIFIQNAASLQRSNQEVGGKFRILRDATAIWTGASQTFYQGAFGSVSANEMSAVQTFNYLDSPSTTSAVTYKLQQASNGGGHNIKSQLGNTPSIITLMEVLA
jgi:hypothetical protein